MRNFILQLQKRLHHTPRPQRGTVIAWLCMCIAIGVAIYLYMQMRTLQQSTSITPQMGEAHEQVKDIIDRVGRHVQLPPDEQPTIATVSDPGKLADKQFFAHAIEGDVVVFYPKSGKALLYRPSLDKIIEFGKVNLGNAETTPSIPPQPTNAPQE